MWGWCGLEVATVVTGPALPGMEGPGAGKHPGSTPGRRDRALPAEPAAMDRHLAVGWSASFPFLSYAWPTTSHTSTLTKVAGASGRSRKVLKVASAERAFSSLSNSQNECWMRSDPSTVRAQYPPRDPVIPCNIAVPLSPIIPSISSERSALTFTRPITACMFDPHVVGHLSGDALAVLYGGWDIATDASSFSKAGCGFTPRQAR